MALTTQQKALLDLYIDETSPNTILRQQFAASDDLVISTITAWIPSAVDRRNNVIGVKTARINDAQNSISIEQNDILEIQSELSTLTAD